MIPIQELLNRIKWDKSFGAGRFEITYYDRVEEKNIRIPMTDVFFDEADHFSFQCFDPEGETHTIPLHRIREVFKDGKLIWHRKA
ncbi:MAG TPA: DUF504 domain-containing protein [Sedimenticola sp.]|nr:DUF504 domain-containing protein [Sedimenticola sp.]